MTNTTDLRSLVERYSPEPWDIRRCNMKKDPEGEWVRLSALTAAQDRIEALEAQQENAVQAMAEAHNSWEARCYAIMAMLEQDFGGFSTDAPDVGSWYEMNSRRMQKRIEELEATAMEALKGSDQ